VTLLTVHTATSGEVTDRYFTAANYPSNYTGEETNDYQRRGVNEVITNVVRPYLFKHGVSSLDYWKYEDAIRDLFCRAYREYDITAGRRQSG
jgi:hypothetical protein